MPTFDPAAGGKISEAAKASPADAARAIRAALRPFEEAPSGEPPALTSSNCCPAVLKRLGYAGFWWLQLHRQASQQPPLPSPSSLLLRFEAKRLPLYNLTRGRPRMLSRSVVLASVCELILA